MSKIVILISVILAITISACESQESTDDLASLTEKHLRELDRPWPVDCKTWSMGVEKKRKCAIAALSLADEDSARSIATIAKILIQFHSMEVENQRLYAPVLSKIAVMSVGDPGLPLVLWQEAYRLGVAASVSRDCGQDDLKDWLRRIQIEGVIVLTRAVYKGNDPTQSSDWLEQARQLAFSADCPEMAPLDEPEELDREPKILHWEAPEYHEVARRAGIEGTVIVKVLVSECGDVMQTEILNGVHQMLDDAALAAAATCRFSPGRVGGVPTKAYMALPFNFQLN